MDTRHEVSWSAGGQHTPSWAAAGEIDRTLETLRSLAGHLAVAALQLANEEGVAPEAAARYRAAEALLRAQAADHGLRPVSTQKGPFVRLANGEEAPLALLCAGFREPYRNWTPTRTIDAGLVLLAKELLIGLRWSLPGEEGDNPQTGRRDGTPAS